VNDIQYYNICGSGLYMMNLSLFYLLQFSEPV